MTTSRSSGVHVKVKKTISKPKRASGDDSGFSGYFQVVTTSIKEIGVFGFLVAFFCFIFWQYASDKQKSEFIDLFFLFKDIEEHKFPYGLVVGLLITSMIIQHYFSTRERKQIEKELERVSDEKKHLQELLNNKQLKTSK